MINDKDLQVLHLQQMQGFQLAKQNFEGLKEVVHQDVLCNDFSIRLQYNPARMISTNAKTDKATLDSRPCFLCTKNLPIGQSGIAYGEKYHIFVNPYPIFEPHFTVPSNDHTPQRIDGHFKDLLNLAFDFQEYTAFYNGASCGASLPTHFHFQLVPRHIMPVEKDANDEQLKKKIVQGEEAQIFSLKNYLRTVFILQSSCIEQSFKAFQAIQEIIGQATPFEDEPKMNILAWYEDEQWTIAIFPRKQQRPLQFFAEGEEKILFSPGCVDMAGVIVAPRKEDYDRYSAPLLTDLFSQITITAESEKYIIDKLQNLNL